MAPSARLDELKKKFDENPRRYFAPLANEYRKQGELAQAIALCRTHLPNQQGHISGHIVLAQALYESNELAESRQAFEAALDLDPENLIALRYLGDIARVQGEPTEAQAWYQRVLDADPRNDEIAHLIRDVEAEASAQRAVIASQPTPAASRAIAEVPSWEAPAEPAVEDNSWSAHNANELAETEAALGSGEPVAELSTGDATLDDWFSQPAPQAELPAPEALAALGSIADSAPPPAADAPLDSHDLTSFTSWEVLEETAPEPLADPAASETVQGAAEADADLETLEFDVETVQAAMAAHEAQPAPQPSEWEPIEASAAAEEPAPTEQFWATPQPSAFEESMESADPIIGRTPTFNEPIAEETPAPFVTETMAELYLQQGFTDEALAIYRQLLAQSPGDSTIAKRIAALEQGSQSAVVNFDANAEPTPAPAAPSVRSFFARFASRRPRSAQVVRREPNEAADDDRHAAFGGAARRDEAMTQPDEQSSLAAVFQAPVGTEDAQAAGALASAFGVQAEPQGELSLEHLFRDVEARSPGAVTSGESANGSSHSAQGLAGPVESHADVEQFTAWLEGLKKK